MIKAFVSSGSALSVATITTQSHSSKGALSQAQCVHFTKVTLTPAAAAIENPPPVVIVAHSTYNQSIDSQASAQALNASYECF